MAKALTTKTRCQKYCPIHVKVYKDDNWYYLQFVKLWIDLIYSSFILQNTT